MVVVQVALTQAEFEQAATRLQQKGMTIQGLSGRIVHQGVTVAWSYINPILSMSVVSKPFFMSEGFIESSIRSWFQKGE